MSIEAKLKELGIVLEKGSTSDLPFIPVIQTGNLVFTSGQVCRRDGELLFTGKVGEHVSIEGGQQAAKQCIVNCLSVLQEDLGSLDRIKRVVKVLGFVQSADNFKEQPTVINAASELLLSIFGEKGKHARSAIGVNGLPGDTPVEIEVIVEI